MKRHDRILCALCAALMSIALCVPVFAVEQESLTPDGNMKIVDDMVQTKNDAAVEVQGKQFITVESKNGNIFYIVIDRTGGKENVYFLNQVDEADLLALTEETKKQSVCTCGDKCYAGHVDVNCPVCASDMTKCNGKETEIEQPEAEQQPAESVKTEKQSIDRNAILTVGALVLVGGGAVMYALTHKKNKRPEPEYDEGEVMEFEKSEETEDDE